MIKVGIECESIENDSYGIARIIKKLLEELSRRPAGEFKFVLFFKAVIPNLPELNNPVFEKKLLKVPSFSIYYYIALPIYLWFKPVDVMFWPNYMLSPLAFSKSIVNLTEDVYYETRSNNIGFQYRLAYKIFCTWAARFATRIMTFSETSAKEVSKLFHINPKRIVANPLGIDKPGKTGEPKGHFILYVGQAFARRHLRETLLAFEKVAQEMPQLNFVFVGPDKYSPPIIDKLIAKINASLGDQRIIHQPVASDHELEHLYNTATALTYISDREAFGLPPVEALAHGTVPIVSETEVSREIFGNHAIFIKDSHSVDEIASAIKESISNREKVAQILSAADSIAEKYAWSAYTDRLLQTVKKIA